MVPAASQWIAPLSMMPSPGRAGSIVAIRALVKIGIGVRPFRLLGIRC
jgi:hypothetical protein